MLKNNSIKLRLLKDSNEDYHLLYKWYQNENVYKYFEQRTLDYSEVVNKYKNRTKINSNIPVYMILYNNNPIGIIQYNKKHNYNYEYDYELDIFIGEYDYYNKGIGKIALNLLINKLGNHKYMLVVEEDNIRAIKCYLGVGFIIIDHIKEENTIGIIKEKLVMIYDKRK